MQGGDFELYWKLFGMKFVRLGRPSLRHLLSLVETRFWGIRRLKRPMAADASVRCVQIVN